MQLVIQSTDCIFMNQFKNIDNIHICAKQHINMQATTYIDIPLNLQRKKITKIGNNPTQKTTSKSLTHTTTYFSAYTNLKLTGQLHLCLSP